MLILLRVVFGLLFLHVIRLALDNAAEAPLTGDLANAGYLGIALLLAIANAAVWAPLLGTKLAAPITGTFTEGTYQESRSLTLQTLRFCRRKGWHSCALGLAVLEGVLHPERPAAFIAGLQCARPGSRWERIFALELWRFDNIQTCRRAFKILQQHQVDPRPHHNQEVNLTLMALDRPPAPESKPLAITNHTPPPEPRRDHRIQLFAGADQSPSHPRAKDNSTP